MLIPQNSTFNLVFIPHDTTFPDGVPNVDPWNITAFVNGAIAPVTTPQTLPQMGGGRYLFVIPASLTTTLGQLLIIFSGTDPQNPAETALFFNQDMQVVPASLLSSTGVIALLRAAPVAAFPFPMYSPGPTPTLLTGLTVSGQRSLDGGAFVTLAATPTEIGSGWYTVSLTAAETNAAIVALRFSAGGAQDTLVQVITQPT
jgi:hypothetical protein